MQHVLDRDGHKVYVHILDNSKVDPIVIFLDHNKKIIGAARKSEIKQLIG